MKKIDAIDIIRSIRENQYKETKGKTNKEIIAYFRQKAAKFSKVKELQN